MYNFMFALERLWQVKVTTIPKTFLRYNNVEIIIVFEVIMGFVAFYSGRFLLYP